MTADLGKEALHNDNPEFLTPTARRNEMLGRLAEGLNDVPISRTNFTWGVGMPGDEKHGMGGCASIPLHARGFDNTRPRLRAFTRF